MNNKIPMMSIIMPLYNAEKYLGDAIESILNQTFQDFELLIIDDYSTDNSLKLAQEYEKKDNRIKILRNNYKKGIVGALNTGMENAKGIYIARADADDINRPYRFEKQYNYLERNKDIYLIGGGYAPFNDYGHRVDIFHPTSSLEIARKFISDSFFCHPSVMFRREIYDEFGGYPDEEAEDFAYFSKVVRKYRCSNIKDILIDYREHSIKRSFTSAEGINKSVKKTFLENYFFYMGDVRYAEEFYEFQTCNRLRFKNLPKIFRINLIILNKIRKQYRMSLFHIEYILLNIKIFWKYLWILTFKVMRLAKNIIKNTPLYPILVWWRNWREIKEWYAQGKPVPPPHIIKQKVVKEYAKNFSIKIFVETGTFLGEMVFAVRNVFDEIYSIELSKDLANKAKTHFARFSYIHIYEGDSSKVLAMILSSINQSCLFWLDAHYSSGITARGELDTPIMEEIAHIFAHPIENHVILIDDARDFVGKNDYPTIEALRTYVLQKRPQWKFEVRDDIIRIHP